jgi:hypothetical protein
MRNNFGFDAKTINMNITAHILWMEYALGEGELEIGNQGRFWNLRSFTQGTEAIGQHTPRIGADRPKLREYSAGCACDSDSTPHFFFLTKKSGAITKVLIENENR